MEQTRLIGYARVSTQEQEVNLQIDAIKNIRFLKNHIFYKQNIWNYSPKA